MEQWTYWRYLNEEQKQRNAVKNEFEIILYNDPVRTLINYIIFKVLIIN